MTPEEKAEKYLQDRRSSQSAFNLSDEIKQAYLAGYAEKVDLVCNVLADIETSFESFVFDKLEWKNADKVLSMLQKIIVERLNELKESK